MHGPRGGGVKWKQPVSSVWPVVAVVTDGKGGAALQPVLDRLRDVHPLPTSLAVDTERTLLPPSDISLVPAIKSTPW